MKNILITGATGFIGKHLLTELLNQKHEITAIVRDNSKHLNLLPQHKNLKIIQGNLDKYTHIKQQITQTPIDIFYHLAWGGTRYPERDDEEIQKMNYNQAINAVKLAIEIGCKTFIGTGSQAECGKCIGKITEQYPANPTTQYGKYKLKSYYDAMELAQQNKIHFIWTRIFSLYGQDDYSGTLIMSLLKKMTANEQVDLTECTQLWNYLHVKDAAVALRKLGEQKCTMGIYNLANNETKQLKEFVLQVKETVNSKSKINFGGIPYTKEGIVSFNPIIDKIQSEIDWNPQIAFEDGIKEIVKTMELNKINVKLTKPSPPPPEKLK